VETVRLTFLPPLEENIVTLHIYEAASSAGPFNEIESTNNVGTYPNYIDVWETTLAASASDWFAIVWEDSTGWISDLSVPVQGGTIALLSEIVERVKLRNSAYDENVVAQEAEAVIQSILQTTTPDTVLISDVLPKQIAGMTLLTMARVALYSILVSGTSTSVDWSAGLVSMKQSSGVNQQIKLVESIIEQANKELGLNYSVVMLLEDIQVAGGYTQVASYDVSRALIELA